MEWIHDYTKLSRGYHTQIKGFYRMGKKKHKKTWEEFEEIVFKVLLELFGLKENELNQLTRSTKDGGYDGVFFIPVCSGETMHFFHAIFEAKLRTNIHLSLPLQEFAKALIIAINCDTDRVIIASNLTLSKNTTEILERFSFQTDLQIQFLRINEVIEWLNSHPKDKYLYSDNIIELLNNSYEINGRKELSLRDLGWDIKEDPVVLFCKKHFNKKIFIEKMLENPFGILLVSGDVGIGKTTFIRALSESFSKRKIQNLEIDLSDKPTPRVLFISIMQNIWKMPYKILDSISSEDFDSAISWVGTEYIPDNIKSAVNIAFKKSAEEYRESSDIFNYFLVSYLRLIYKQLTRRRKYVLSFLNLNHATKETLDFLLLFAREMSEHIFIILEIRTSLYIDNYMSLSKWEEFKTEFFKLANVKDNYTPEKLEDYEIQNYINYIWKEDFPKDCVSIVIQHTGYSLLYINAFVTYLKCSGWGSIPNPLKKSELEKIAVGIKENILSALCRTLCEQDVYYVKLFFITAIFQGQLPRNIIEETIGYNTKNIDYLIKETEIYQLTKNDLKIKHLCYLDVLDRMDYIGETLKLSLSLELLDKNIVYRYISEDERKQIIQIRLYEISLMQKKLISACLKFAEDMYQRGQYHFSFQYVSKAQKTLSDIPVYSSESKWEKIKIWILLLQNEIVSHNLDEEKIHTFIDEIEKMFSLFPQKEQDDYCNTYMSFILVKNRIYHYEGNYKNSLEIMKVALNFMERNRENLTDVLRGECWKEYAIAVKENYSIKKCLQVFRKARRDCPGERELIFSNLTHISEKYSTFNPKIAMRSLKLIETFENDLSIPSIYHNRINMAFMQMYQKNYPTALSEGLEILEAVNKYGLKGEESRCCNLLGCLYFISQDIEQATIYFEHGINLLNRKKQITTLWPLLANFSSILLYQEKWEDLYQILSESKKIYIENYMERIIHFNFSSPKYPKLFVAVLLLFYNFLQLEKKKTFFYVNDDLRELKSIFTSLEFKNYFSLLKTGTSLCSILKDTPFVHKEYIIIKT